MRAMINKENKVPFYQAHYQKNDGVRLWMKHPRSKMLLYPYFCMVGLGFLGGIYGMGRMVAGKKTYY
ncbi:hypothetical protein EDC01DRAFT_669978 [Geopyxis carbonaria]|nr:hypothetical protein EDC01DRAFT_669978 [Geopyxis carbonaria]